MKLDSKKLSNACNIVWDFVAKHATLPIITLVKFSVVDKILKMYATDMERYITYTYWEVDSDDVEFMVDINKVKDVLSVYKEWDVTLLYNADKQQVTLQFGKSKLSHLVQDVKEYTVFPKTDKEWTQVDTLEMLEAINFTSSFIKEKSYQIEFTGMMIKWSKACGTDWYAMWLFTFNEDTWLDIIIPYQTLQLLKKVMTWTCTFTQDRFLLHITWENYNIITITIQWQYPDVVSLVNNNKDWSEFLLWNHISSLPLAIKTGKDRNNAVVFNDNTITATGDTWDFVWECLYSWPKLCINGNYIKTITQYIWETIQWKLWGFLYIQQHNKEIMIKPLSM